MILDQIKEKGNPDQVLCGHIVLTQPQSLLPSANELPSCFKLLEALFYTLLVPEITNSIYHQAWPLFKLGGLKE